MLYSSTDLQRPADQKRQRKSIDRAPYSEYTAREYGRIIHSKSFRRLQGKMQLFPPARSPLLRNRLTHSLEVTDIASRITTHLNKTARCASGHRIDAYIVTAVALAHDLGHPPVWTYRRKDSCTTNGEARVI